MKAKQARLVLGTVQLGLPYGAANVTGMPTTEAAIGLVRAAVRNGIAFLDTAHAYGEAEHRIGLALDSPSDVVVATKLDPLTFLPVTASASEAERAAAASLAASRDALKRQKLDVVLLHRANHRTLWNGAAWKRMLAERSDGGIDRIGVSAQNPAEALDALADPDVGHIQLPFNILDHRWMQSDFLSAVRSRPDVTIHVRSVFLQGLLAGTAAARWPKVSGVDPDRVRENLASLQRRLNRTSLTDLCIAFVRAQPWIDGIVVGMETIEQLHENLALFERTPLDSAEASAAGEILPVLPESFLDPARWPASQS